MSADVSMLAVLFLVDPTDPWAQLPSLGIGALVAIPFIVVWRSALKRVAELEERLETRDQAMIRREQEISGGAVPVITQAAEALRSVQQGMTAVADARRQDLDEALKSALLRTLEAKAEDHEPRA